MSTAPEEARPQRRTWLAPAVIVVVTLTAAILFVLSSLRKPPLETWVVTAPAPAEAGEELVGPRTYTIDASVQAEWAFFDFSLGSAVGRETGTGWDLAFRRFGIMTNGGDGFAGGGGAIDLGPVAFDSVMEAPATGYTRTDASSDSTNAVLDRWYDYSFTSHILSTKGHIYVIRLADGRYAKLQIVGYYCAGATPGCITFRYVYQGNGSRSFEPDTMPPAVGPSRSLHGQEPDDRLR